MVQGARGPGRKEADREAGGCIPAPRDSFAAPFTDVYTLVLSLENSQAQGKGLSSGLDLGHLIILW